MGRLLLGVARLLARLPEQRKLLKVRVSDMHGQAAPGWGILEQRKLLKVRVSNMHGQAAPGCGALTGTPA